jgi:general L-amino acid transport system ATP-binding protein
LIFSQGVAHRIIFMDEGRIVEKQPPNDFFFASPKTDRAKLVLSQILDH